MLHDFGVYPYLSTALRERKVLQCLLKKNVTFAVTRFVWLRSKLARDVATIMVRINMFRSRFAQRAPGVNTFYNETYFIRSDQIKHVSP